MNLQVYAQQALIEPSDTTDFDVYLKGVDPSNVLGQFSSEDKLDSMELGDIIDYVTRKQRENEQ